MACTSAKLNAGTDIDVVLITNIDIPDPYASLFKDAGVLLYRCPFDCFTFDNDYKWSLAYYKLCALSHIVSELPYSLIAYLDIDVYVQSSFRYIWNECSHNICLYDICHGLQTENYQRFLKEAESYYHRSQVGLTHFGGEFFAANKQNAKLFVETCRNIYESMKQKGIRVNTGDEFIVSLAAHEMSGYIRNAGAYISRYWTRRFRLVSTNYEFNPVMVLHCPAEKKYGLIRIYNYYKKKKRFPSRNRVWAMLHLSRPSLIIRVALWWTRMKESFK